MADPVSLSFRRSQPKSDRILSYPVNSGVDSEDEKDEASDTATIFSAITATTAASATTATTAANVEPYRDRSLTMMRPEMSIPAEFSTADNESQNGNEKSALELLWNNVMDRGSHRGFTTYTNVQVLLLCWADNCDDLTTKEEVTRLSATFEKRFNFHTQIKYLDTSHRTRSQLQVNSIVASYVGAHDGPRTLLIVYYAGHGRPGSLYGSLELFGFVELALCFASSLILAGLCNLKKMKRDV